MQFNQNIKCTSTNCNLMAENLIIMLVLLLLSSPRVLSSFVQLPVFLFFLLMLMLLSMLNVIAAVIERYGVVMVGIVGDVGVST